MPTSVSFEAATLIGEAQGEEPLTIQLENVHIEAITQSPLGTATRVQISGWIKDGAVPQGSPPPMEEVGKLVREARRPNKTEPVEIRPNKTEPVEIRPEFFGSF